VDEPAIGGRILTGGQAVPVIDDQACLAENTQKIYKMLISQAGFARI
jgi:hypothetical protein